MLELNERYFLTLVDALFRILFADLKNNHDIDKAMLAYFKFEPLKKLEQLTNCLYYLGTKTILGNAFLLREYEKLTDQDVFAHSVENNQAKIFYILVKGLNKLHPVTIRTLVTYYPNDCCPAFNRPIELVQDMKVRDSKFTIYLLHLYDAYPRSIDLMLQNLNLTGKSNRTFLEAVMPRSDESRIRSHTYPPYPSLRPITGGI